MSLNKIKILFVSHDASQTGAPIVLLHFLQWLKEKEFFEFSIFLMQGGELEEKFRKVATTYVSKKLSLAKKIHRKIDTFIFAGKWEKHNIPALLRKQKYDIVYINTVVPLEFTSVFKQLYNCKIICHVHENALSIQAYYSSSLRKENINNVDNFIAVSKSTRHNLEKNFFIPSDRIHLIHECISLKLTKHPTVSKDVIKKELGITNEFIIGGSGSTTWRKGVDLFIQLITSLNKLKPNNNIRLIWVGGLTPEFSHQLNYEMERLNIRNQIDFVGAKVQPENYFQIFDVFALTSREDPFPLVALEAAALGKPIICFENSGGIPELVSGNNGGRVVPYGNTEDMAKAILTLKEKPQELIETGKAAEKLMEEYDVEVIGTKISNVIKQL